MVIGVLFFAGCKAEDKHQPGELSASKTVLYVAPDGSDDNPGTKAKPFATIDRAKAHVRKLKTKVNKPITILVLCPSYIVG